MKYIKKSKTPILDKSIVLFKSDNIYVVSQSNLDHNNFSADGCYFDSRKTNLLYLPDFLPLTDYLAKIPNCHKGLKKTRHSTHPITPYLSLYVKDYTDSNNSCALTIDDVWVYSTEPYALIRTFEEKSGRFVGDTLAILISDLELSPEGDPEEYHKVYETADIIEIDRTQLYVPQTLPDRVHHAVSYPIGLIAYNTVSTKGYRSGLLTNNASKVKARQTSTKIYDFYSTNANLILRHSRNTHVPTYRAAIVKTEPDTFYSTVDYAKSIKQLPTHKTQNQIQNFLNLYGQGKEIVEIDNFATDTYGLTNEIKHNLPRYNYERDNFYYIAPKHLGMDYSDVQSIDYIGLEFVPVGTIDVINDVLFINGGSNDALYLKTLDGFAPISKCQQHISKSNTNPDLQSPYWNLTTSYNQYITQIGNDLCLPIHPNLRYRYYVLKSTIYGQDSLAIYTSEVEVFDRTFTNNKSQKLKPIKIDSQVYTVVCIVKVTTQTGSQQTVRINYHDLSKGEQIV